MLCLGPRHFIPSTKYWVNPGKHRNMTELLRAVGNMSDCISRRLEFDPGPVPYFRRY